MLSIIRKWLGLAALEAEVDRLKQENDALRKGEAVVLPDGKVAITPPLPKFDVKMRNRSWATMARRREGEIWRDLVREAYPNAEKRG